MKHHRLFGERSGPPYIRPATGTRNGLSFELWRQRFSGRLWGFATVIVSSLLILAACGDLEIPASGASGSGSQASGKGSDPRFVGASAVVVGRGDTVYAISRRHNVSPRAIIEANGLQAPYLLTVGQRLQLPRPKFHVVKSGDTLYGISRTYGTDTFTLAKINNLKEPYRLYVGTKLVVPSDGSKATKKSKAAQKQTTTAKANQAKPSTTPRTQTRKPKPVVYVPKPPARSGKFVWPVDGKVISSFGAKDGGYHNDGINIRAKRGAPVKAAENGVVVYAGNELRGFGNLLLIKHADGYVTAYAHNDTLLVKKGDKVKKGAKIATVGSTGSVTTPQLHFEVRKGRQARDPKRYLS